MKTLHLLLTSLVVIIFLSFGLMSVHALSSVKIEKAPYQILSPLKQFKMGTFAQGVLCNTGLQLFFKAEDYTPVCAQSGTATMLLKRGWATTHPPEPYVEKIAINGLQKNYTVGQPIGSVMVNYAGYYWYTEPDVKILDASGTQIWFNCPYCHTRSTPVPRPSLDAFTYIVRDYASNKFSVINKTGTYTMIASVGNDTASARFTVIKLTLPNITGLENDTGIVTFGNRTYYFETPHYTQDAYVNPVHISFHGVVFTLFPPGFKGGLPTNFGGVAANGCSGSYFWTDAKFADDTHVLLNIFALTTMSQQCLALPAPTYFTTNTDPLAGLTFYDGKMKLLVSVEGKLQQNNPVFSTSIPTNETIYHDFPQPRGYSIINSTQGIIVNNDAEVSNLTGFSVKSPTDLPQGYKVKLIKASKEIPLVTIFVSKYPLTDDITSHDFLWNQQGILITYDKTSPHELENFKQIFYGPENKIITINGTLAVISDISKQYYHGYPYDMWASLVAIKDNNTNIAIRGFFNSDDLIKIATSMLEK